MDNKLFSLESILNDDKIQSKETFFVNVKPYFYLVVALTMIREDILNKLQECDSDYISEINNNFRMCESGLGFSEELQKMIDLTKQEMIGFINILKDELSKRYILDSEFVNDFVEKINYCYKDHNFITIRNIKNFCKFDFREFNSLDENLTKLIPKNGINKDDVKLVYICKCGKHFKYEFSKDYLTYHNNKIVNIFKNIAHSDNVIVDKMCCFNLIDSDNFLDNYMYSKREDYERGAIFMDFRVRSNFKPQILKLIKKYRIEYTVDELFKNLI